MKSASTFNNILQEPSVNRRKMAGRFPNLLIALLIIHVQVAHCWLHNVNTSSTVRETPASDPVPEEDCPVTCTCTLNYKTMLSVSYCTRDPLPALPKLLSLYPKLKELTMCQVCLSQIPPEISTLSELSVLRVKKNSIQFVPNEVFGLTDMNKLDMSFNKLDAIPSGLSKLSTLTFLNIGYNNIKTLPTELSVMNLKYLNLVSNALQKIPDAIFNLKYLKSLDLNTNNIGIVPKRIAKLLLLEKLDLSHNNISVLPGEISSLGHLSDLYLMGNGLDNVPLAVFSLSSLTYLVLAENDITILPREIGNLPKLQVLDMNHNRIRGLPKEMSKLLWLKKLDLSYNCFRSMLPEFCRLPYIKRLYLRHNEIATLADEISQLFHLEILDLSHNKIVKLPSTISKLPNLKELNIGFNMLHKLPETVSHLQKLQTFDLRYNSLPTVPAGVFNLSNIQHLYLENNKLRNLVVKTTGSSQLLSLNLSCNQMEKFPHELSKLSQLETLIFSNNALQTIPSKLSRRLSFLDLSYNYIKNIPCHLSKLQFLSHLYLNNNKIDRLNCNLTTLKYLSVLRLDHNGLTSMPCELSGTSSLAYLYLSHNAIPILHKNCLENLPILLYLDLSFNKIGTLYHWTLNWVGSIREIYLDHNNIQVLEPELFHRCFDNIRKVKLSNNKIITLDSWPLALSTHYPGFEIDLSNNLLSNFTNRVRRFFISIQNGSIFNFKMNNISHFMDIFWGWNMKVDTRESIQTLLDETTFDLGGNPLVCDCIDYAVYEYIHHSDSAMYSNLTCYSPMSLRGKRLQQVTLEQFVCYITENCPFGCVCTDIPYSRKMQIDCENYDGTDLPSGLPIITRKSTFYHLNFANRNLNKVTSSPYLPKVTTMVLSNNSISDIDKKVLMSLGEIQVFHVDNNNLQHLPSTVTYISNDSIADVRLGNNPWVCDCEALTLVKWILSNKKRINDTENIICASPRNMKGIRLVDINTPMLCAMQNTTAVYIVTVLAAVIFVCFIYVGIKDKIKYFHWRLFGTDECDGEGKEFDVFVSYADDDEAYVGEYLIPELEKRGFKVCFHCVHFHGGKPIHVNIYECIEKSKRMLIFFSPNFYDSKFSMFEFHAAQDLDIRNGTRRLLSIKDENLDMDQFDITVRSYFKTHTYIRRGDENFWKNLVYTLPRKRLGIVEA